MSNRIQVLILSAGTGYRLTPYSIGRPKVLCSVGNSSILSRLLIQLKHAGIRQAVIAMPLMPVEIQNAVKKLSPAGFDLRLFFPDNLTNNKVSIVKAIMKARTSSVLVIYGDSLLSVDFHSLIQFHEKVRKNGALATILYHRPFDLRVAEKKGKTYHGIMSLLPSGVIKRFEEKPRVDRIVPGFDVANGAVFICEKSLLAHPLFKHAKDFSFDIFQPAVREKMPIYGFNIGDGFRFDVGSISRLYEANIKVIRKEFDAPILLKEKRPGIWIGKNTKCQLNQIQPPVLLGNSVSIEKNVRIGPDVVIGDGTIIKSGVNISRSVIMKSCIIGDDSHLDCCMLGDNCVIQAGLKLPRFTVLGSDCVIGGHKWPNVAERKEYRYV